MKAVTLFVLLCISGITNAANYYFSNITGNDSRTRLAAQDPLTPWRTLSKLNAEFSSFQPGDSIFFKSGETFYGSITISRSETAAPPIILSAYGTGGKPIITGLTTLSSWTNLGGGLYEKTLTSPPTHSLNMVLFDGALQPIGRFPKAGLGNASYYTIQSFQTSNPVWVNSSGVLTSTDISSIPNFVGGELVQRTYQWIIDRSTVVAQSPTTISYSSLSSPDHMNFSYSPVNTHGFFFQNHINTLTRLGEWAYNQATKKITMYFGTEDPNAHTVEVATIDNLVSITTKTGITINNIVLKGANERGINLDAAAYCVFNSTDISYIGINAIDVTGNLANTHHNIVDGCIINQTNNNAINCNRTDSWTIRNSHIQNTAINQGMGISGDGQYFGIYNAGANSVVESNHIENTGYCAISFSEENIIIRYNHIHNYCQVKSDGGGIYTFGNTGSNRLIHKNIVYDGTGDLYGLGLSDPGSLFEGQVHGIYLDDGTQNVTITGNTSFRNSNSGLLVNKQSASITATGNTFYDNKTTQLRLVNISSSIVTKQNILFARRSGSLALYLEAGTPLAAINSDDNYLCRPIWEPNGINSPGYTTSPISWQNYHDGGTVQSNNRFYSIENWASISTKDPSSKKTPVSITNLNDIRFEYNTSNVDKTVILNGNYRDLNNVYYTSVSLPPYSSTILLKAQQIVKTDQTINFAPLPSKTFGEPSFTVIATATSGLNVSFRVVSGPASLSGDVITLNGTGTVIIEASQAGNLDYNAAFVVTQSFIVAKADQTIDFPTIDSSSYSNPVFQLNATASSGLDVSFRIVSGPATLSNNIIVVNGNGTVVVEASQGGDDKYNSAPIITRSFTTHVVVLASQTINFAPLRSKTFGEPSFTITATASSGLVVNFRIVSGPATISGDKLTLTGVGTVTIEASQPGNKYFPSAIPVNQSFSVFKSGDLTIISTFPSPLHTTATVRVHPSESGETTVDLYDITGKLVQCLFKGYLESGRSKTFVLHRGRLVNGTYVVRLVTNSKVASQKIIVN